MQTPHKHRDLIIAWANGEQIQFKDDNGIWRDSTWPTWDNNYEYRVKPKGPGFYRVGMRFRDSRGAVHIIGAISVNCVNLFELEGGDFAGYRVKVRHFEVDGFTKINIEEFHEYFGDEYTLIETESEGV